MNRNNNSSSNNKRKWKLEGDYFEGCNCKSICPCVFMLDPNQGECKAAVAWHIEKGYYEDNDGDKISLNGLNTVAIFDVPGSMFSGPKWKTALYVDEKADQEQKDALTKIFSGEVGGFFEVAASRTGEVLGIKEAAIEFSKDGKKRKIIIPSALALEIEGMTGSDQNKESVITNTPFVVAPGFEPIVAHSTQYDYKDYGLEWNNTGKNAFYSRFTYTP